MSLLDNVGNASPLSQAAGDATLGPGVDVGLLTGRDGTGVEGERGNGTASGLGVDGDGLPVDVVDAVTGQVVAAVLGSTGTGEETGGGDTELEEGDVVRGGAEATVLSRNTLGYEVVVEDVATNLVGVGVSIDGVGGVDGTNHVVVEVELDGISLSLGEGSTIVVGATETALLSTPPGETDLVLEALVLLDGASKLEEGSAAAAVVVDTGTLLDTVQVGTEDDDAVWVTLLGLGDDVPGLAVLGDGIDDEGDAEALASDDGSVPLVALLVGDDTDRGDGAVVISAEGGSTDAVAGHVVDEDSAHGTEVLGEAQLVGNGAGTTLDEGDLAGHVDALPLIGEAARAAHVVDGDGDELTRHTTGQGGGVVVLQGGDADVLAAGPRQGDEEGGGEEGGKGLDRGVEVLAEPGLDALEDEFHGGVVAGEAKGTVTAVVTGNLVEVPEDVLEPELGGMFVSEMFYKRATECHLSESPTRLPRDH